MTAMYIDPAATTVIITSISGIVIAVGAAAVIFWRKAKKKVANVLHIDENANKEVEEELTVDDDVK
jgi:MFS superfamily sulfate permease-like transporter